MSKVATPEILRRLGIRTGLNCSGTRTVSGGALVWPEVREAMDAVTPVNLDLTELNEKAGEHLARLCGAEAGFVSSGAAGGMMLQAAACIAGTDTSKIQRLPDTEGMKNEIVIYRGHRIRYDQAWRKTGAMLVEYGDMRNCDPWQLEEAISPNTAAVAYVVGPTLHPVALPMDEVCRIAHRHDVPVIVDAAAMLPPRANLRRFVEQGADMVTFSGGKGVRGPQGTGILIGRHDLIEAAVANAAPNHSIGRACKVTKEEIVGLIVAVEVFLQQDEEEEFRHWSEQCKTIVDALAEVPGLHASVEYDGVDWVLPSAVIRMEPEWNGPTVKEAVARLREGDPPIWIGTSPIPGTMFVKTMTLSDDEVELVAGRLSEALTGPAT